MPARHWAALTVLVAIACLAGLAFGSVPLGIPAVWHALAGDGTPLEKAIVLTLRAPRVLLAALVGAGLASAGAALQGATRNPLAEPYLLGVSGGAAVGAVVAVALRAPGAVVPLAAFAGALAAVALTVGVARGAGGAGSAGDPRIVLMAGVVVGAFANAAIMVALANTDATAVRGALWWMMGSAADAQWATVSVLALYVGGGVALLLALGRAIDVLALGGDAATGLGVNVTRVSLAVYGIGALLAAGTVAAAGLVGFVGLVVPQLARAWGARTHRDAVGASTLLGAVLVVLADIVARTVVSPTELPLGAVTALVGVPVFFLRLRRLT